MACAVVVLVVWGSPGRRRPHTPPGRPHSHLCDELDVLAVGLRGYDVPLLSDEEQQREGQVLLGMALRARGG